MVPPVKGSGPGRGQARTRLARRAVIEAARALFAELGYAATRIEAVSDRSDVPPATVYRLFGSKLGILKALLDASIAGDDEARSLPDRPEVEALLAEPDPRTQLAGLARMAAGINARSGQVYQILVSAAGADPTAAGLLGEYRRQRREGQSRIAQALARGGSLRPELHEHDAADIIHALLSPEVYRLLVMDCGWAPKRYAEWVRAILVEQLLGPERYQGSRSQSSR